MSKRLTAHVGSCTICRASGLRARGLCEEGLELAAAFGLARLRGRLDGQRRAEEAARAELPR